MKEVILCKYGEIALKGLNKGSFEKVLFANIRRRLAAVGDFTIESAQSTIYIRPADEYQDIDAALDAARKVYGLTVLSRAIEVEKTVDALRDAAKNYIPRFLEGAKTFKVEGKRADKTFPLNSPQLCALLGGDILEATDCRVDVHSPDVTVYVEIRDFGAYLHAGSYPGAGGIPVGSGGRGLLLLSGGIDSPVAGCMMAKRGTVVDAVHFESPPYTSEPAKEKVISLARIMAQWCGPIELRVISLTKIQEELKNNCAEEYFTLLLRRSMMRIASRIAQRRGCGALITGESLGQVASQTMPAIASTEDAASLPIFRPCIGLDKEEIVVRARALGTFETSILPYEDCCTVFTPRHPKTRPEIEKVRAQEEKLDLASLEDEALAAIERIRVEC